MADVMTPAKVKELHDKHPMTFHIVGNAMAGMAKLALIANGAPPHVREVLSDAAEDLAVLTAYSLTTLEEAGDECVTRVERAVEERRKEMSQRMAHGTSPDQAEALRNIFGMPSNDGRQRIGFDTNKH